MKFVRQEPKREKIAQLLVITNFLKYACKEIFLLQFDRSDCLQLLTLIMFLALILLFSIIIVIMVFISV